MPAEVREATVRSDGAGQSAVRTRLCDRPERRVGACRRQDEIGFAFAAVPSLESSKPVKRTAQLEEEPPPTDEPAPADATEPQAAYATRIDPVETDSAPYADGCCERPENFRHVALRRPIPESLSLLSDRVKPMHGCPACEIRIVTTNIRALCRRMSRGSGPKPLAPADPLPLDDGRLGCAERARDEATTGLAGAVPTLRMLRCRRRIVNGFGAGVQSSCLSGAPGRSRSHARRHCRARPSPGDVEVRLAERAL